MKSEALKSKLDEKLNKIKNHIRPEINTIKEDFLKRFLRLQAT